MTAFVFVPLGQPGAAWFTSFAALAILVLFGVSKVVSPATLHRAVTKKGKKAVSEIVTNNVKFAITLLVLIVFARSWYSASVWRFYQFFLKEKFHLQRQTCNNSCSCSWRRVPSGRSSAARWQTALANGA